MSILYDSIHYTCYLFSIYMSIIEKRGKHALALTQQKSIKGVPIRALVIIRVAGRAGASAIGISALIVGVIPDL